jgi:hypothetical protein
MQTHEKTVFKKGDRRQSSPLVNIVRYYITFPQTH